VLRALASALRRDGTDGRSHRSHCPQSWGETRAGNVCALGTKSAHAGGTSFLHLTRFRAFSAGRATGWIDGSEIIADDYRYRAGSD